jgi:hypothetical protein
MLFACSSGFTDRYIEDIARSVALPEGMKVQYRYHEDYIHPDERKKLSEPKKLIGQKVVLAYLNQSKGLKDANLPPKIVPVREAEIANVVCLGTAVIFTFVLNKFAYPAFKDVDESQKISFDKYQKHMLSQFDNGSCPLPLKWDAKKGEKAQGFLFCDVKAPELKFEPIQSSYDSWEWLVVELLGSTDFSDRQFGVLYHLLGIHRTAGLQDEYVEVKDGRFVFSKSGEYELHVYTKGVSDNNRKTTWIKCELLNEAAVTRSDPALTIDSGYDLKRFKFNVKNSAQPITEILTVSYWKTLQQDYGSFRYDMTLDFPRSKWRMFFSGLPYGLAGFIPGAVAILTGSNNYSGQTIAIVFSVLFVSSVGLSILGDFIRTKS